MKHHTITDDLEKEIIQNYLSKPMSIGECATKFDLCKVTVSRILNRNNIKKYDKNILYSPNLNEDFFEIIDSEEKAYFLGLIITDGNVFDLKRQNGSMNINITQNDSDAYILEKFLQCVGSNRKVASDGRGCSQATVISKKMAEDLAQYGVFPNKTLFATLPLLDDELMPHLIRGILDGDGNITAHIITNKVTKKQKYLHAISFCGSRVLMNQLSDYISERLGITRKSVYTYSDRYLSEVKWANVLEMFELGMYLYSNATIFLDRKCEIFLDFLYHYDLVDYSELDLIEMD